MRRHKFFAARLAAVILTLSVLISPGSSVLAASEGSDSGAVYVGGMPIGIKLCTGGLLVVGLSPVETESGSVAPAEDAGLALGDIITELDGEHPQSAEEFSAALGRSTGDVSVKYIRGGTEHTVSVSPAVSRKDGQPRVGLWLRDSTAGIGTVTFTECESGNFAALGHGVSTPSGETVAMTRGTALEARICGIKRGEVGAPGELRGYFTGRETGTITKNTSCGVFGTFNEIPINPLCPTPIPLGKRSELKLGDAEIYSTLDGDAPAVYKIKITRLTPDSSSFELEVCDEVLLEKTGGIVQGMSGSPIIQNGRLVGAVTHVLINNPRRGYGIYIEDMLAAAG